MDGSSEADLTIAYDPAEIPSGIPETSLIVVKYDESQDDCVRLSTAGVDLLQHTITVGGLTGFSVFAIASEPPVAAEVET